MIKVLFVAVSLMIVMSGCGYKAPPYYEPAPKEGKNGAV